jgi:hypothetical protein
MRRLLVIAVVTICFAVPLFEAFDRWDRTLEDGYDTESTVVVVALCVGLALAVAGLVAEWIRSLGWRARPPRLNADPFHVITISPPSPDPTGSPPIALRI